MNIHESAEDYLEKILMLQEQKGSVRSIDIAVAMGFSKPSVSVAMKNLRENGYISMDGDGYIRLEEPGLAIARRIYQFEEVTAVYLMSGGFDLMVMVTGASMRQGPHQVAQKSQTTGFSPAISSSNSLNVTYLTIIIHSPFFFLKYSTALEKSTFLLSEEAMHLTFMAPSCNSFPPMTATYFAPILSAYLNCALIDLSM